jgi:uncharacterized protein YegL
MEHQRDPLTSAEEEDNMPSFTNIREQPEVDIVSGFLSQDRKTERDKTMERFLRKWAIYLLLDCSSSMTGKSMATMKAKLDDLLNDLKTDPTSLEIAWLSVITFGNDATQLVPLTEISDFQIPALKSGGDANLGKAFMLLNQCISEEIRKSTSTHKGDYIPCWIVVISNGNFSGVWESAVGVLNRNWKVKVVAAPCGHNVMLENLEKISSEILDIGERISDTVMPRFYS